ncbi:MAG: inositol monophosphatase family protein [Archaeoglobaceae archaeon]
MDEKLALSLSREVAKNVLKAINSIPAGRRGEFYEIGKSGVTKLVDKVAENAALEVLKKEKLRILSEECGYVGEGDVFVALDPLDGTFNAVRGIPIYSVSLCFSDSEKFGDSFFGYVFNLCSCDEYYADSEAYKNEKEIKVGEKEKLEELNAIVYYPDRMLPFKRIRALGSAALETCFVAEGIFDCFIDLRGMLRIFDIAGGVYILEKAGGIAVDEKGNSLEKKKFEIAERVNVIATNKKLYRQLLELVV